MSVPMKLSKEVAGKALRETIEAVASGSGWRVEQESKKYWNRRLGAVGIGARLVLTHQELSYKYNPKTGKTTLNKWVETDVIDAKEPYRTLTFYVFETDTSGDLESAVKQLTRDVSQQIVELR